MNEHWIEGVPHNIMRLAGRIHCPFQYDDRFGGDEYLEDGTLIHKYLNGGYEVCPKWTAVEIIREVIDKVTCGVWDKRWLNTSNSK